MTIGNEYDSWKLDNGEVKEECEHCGEMFDELHETFIHRKSFFYCEACQISQQLEWAGSEE